MNNKEVMFVIFLLVGIFSVLMFVNAESMNFNVNIFAEEVEIVSIELPDSIFFGNVTIGEESEQLRIDVNNTGNVDITVTPGLESQSEEIFSYIEFQRIQNSEYIGIGNYSHNISAPSVPGGVKESYFYATLDLTDFSGGVEEDMLGHNATIIFYAVAQ